MSDASFENLDFIGLGPTPVDEDAFDFGIDPEFDRKNYEECTRFRNLLEAIFLPQLPNEDAHIRFFIKKFPYSESYYREVCVEFNPEHHASREFAYYIENNIPSTWDDKGVHNFKMPS